MSAAGAWPALDWPAWRETAIGLQLRCQIVGKVRLALSPWLNHSWHVPFYVTARGWTTSAIPLEDRILEIDFDLLGDRSQKSSAGDARGIAIAPKGLFRRLAGAGDQLHRTDGKSMRWPMRRRGGKMPRAFKPLTGNQMFSVRCEIHGIPFPLPMR